MIDTLRPSKEWSGVALSVCRLFVYGQMSLSQRKRDLPKECLRQANFNERKLGCAWKVMRIQTQNSLLTADYSLGL